MVKIWATILLFVFLPTLFLHSQEIQNTKGDSLLIKHNKIYRQFVITKGDEIHIKRKRVSLDLLSVLIQKFPDTTKSDILFQNYNSLRKHKSIQGWLNFAALTLLIAPPFYSFQFWNSGHMKNDNFAGVVITSVSLGITCEVLSLIHRKKRFKNQKIIVNTLNHN